MSGLQGERKSLDILESQTDLGTEQALVCRRDSVEGLVYFVLSVRISTDL